MWCERDIVDRPGRRLDFNWILIEDVLTSSSTVPMHFAASSDHLVCRAWRRPSAKVLQGHHALHAIPNTNCVLDVYYEDHSIATETRAAGVRHGFQQPLEILIAAHDFHLDNFEMSLAFERVAEFEVEIVRF